MLGIKMEFKLEVLQGYCLQNKDMCIQGPLDN